MNISYRPKDSIGANANKLMPLPIQLIGISKQLSPTFKLNISSLSIQAGEFFCLLGPSGSGKSTLLGVIGGWITPDKGQLIIGSRECTNLPSFERPVRTCFQKGGFLFPHMTVEENIAYALRVKRIDPQVIKGRVKDLMCQVGLEGLQDRKPFQLSGGESQRVAIARALADPQPILLLDEIQSGLDNHLRASVRDMLVNLTVGYRITSVYVTHDASEALGLASRLGSNLGVLNHGSLDQVGTATDVYRRPQTSFVASLMGEINLLPIQEDIEGTITTTGGNTFILNRKLTSKFKYLAIRPEAISLRSYNEDAIEMSGVVKSIEFLGSTTRIVIRAKGDEIALQQVGTVELPKIDQEISCYVCHTDILPLNE